MGTNYYFEDKYCGECNRGYQNQRLHIGKSSFGWNFALHIIPEEKISELDDWMLLFQKPHSRIVDEYNEVITAEQMVKIICEREDWGAMAVPPGKLKRHEIDKSHCIAHGKGSYDLMIGWFE